MAYPFTIHTRFPVKQRESSGTNKRNDFKRALIWSFISEVIHQLKDLIVVLVFRGSIYTKICIFE